MGTTDEEFLEVLKSYIARLELLTGTERIKVPIDQNDELGNPILPMRGVYLVDDVGGLHESVDISGNRIVRSWPDGSVVDVTGTFTKTVGPGAGSIVINPAEGDEMIIMYGRVTIGPVQAGGAEILTIAILDSTVSVMIPFAATVAINDFFHFPTAFADATVAVGNAIGTPTIHQLMITPGHNLQIALVGMAAAELFSVTFAFRSLLGTVPTVAAVGGTFT